MEKQNPNNKALQFYKLGLLIDIGLGLKNEKMIEEALDLGEQSLYKIKNIKSQATIYYNLANGYQSLYDLTERKAGIYGIPQSEKLQKSKLYLRNAIKNFSECDSDFKKQVWVNYGNCLDTIGRGIEALRAYDMALKIDNNFSMAIGNRAKTLAFFADISGEYRSSIYIEAYQAIKSVIDNKDLIFYGGIFAKQSFEYELKKIESLFKDKRFLEKKLKHPKYSTLKLSKFEKFYLDFCVKEKLFLNFHLHKDNCKAAITDPIFISLITDIEDNKTFYRLAKHINQIKEDYAVARLLLVQSQYRRKDFDNISRRTTLINTLDYSQFNLYCGLLKSSFKEAYNILDKIAFFINNHFCLGLPEKKIYFTSIWEEDKKIRNEILESKNISLYALYDIYKNFKSDHYKKIQNIRNALVHRKLVVFDSVLTAWDKKDDENNIGYDTLLDETINIFKLVKSAIIYLINFVNIEENKKRKNGPITSTLVDTK